jgi:glycerol-3-phosphate dehydrogenase
MGIARERGIEMPIAAEVFGVLFEGRSPAEATDRLMTRPAREEST